MTWVSFANGRREEWHLPTQDGVARDFAERHAGRLRYCHDSAAWFVWDGVAWRRDRMGAVAHLVRALARECSTEPDGKSGATAGGTAFVAGVERFVRDDPALAVTAEAFDADPLLLGTPAGPIALATGMLVPADPALGLSLITGVAQADNSDCPLWRRFLDETFGGDRELIGFLQRFLGYALTGATSEQVVVYGWGTGGNGKSLFLNVVRRVMGDYTRPAALATLTSVDAERHGVDLAALRGARLIVMAESEGGRLWDERRLKLLTGGDPICGRDHARLAYTQKARQAYAAFTPTCKLLAMGNQPPRLAHVDEAIRRRFRIVPFRHRPARPDRDLEARLLVEAPAILRWMIEGCLAWQSDGLGRPEAIARATEDYLDAQDIIGQFLAERCDCAPADAATTAAALFAAWSAFAEAAGEPAGSRRAFGEAMSARGFRRDRTELARRYVGIGLRELTPDTS